MPTTRDPRYIVLCDNGAYAMLGRTEPTAEDLERVVARMARQGCGGWLAVASHSFHETRRPVVSFGRVLRETAVAFKDAADLAGARCTC